MGQQSGGFPVNCLSKRHIDHFCETSDEAAEGERVRAWLEGRGLVATQPSQPFGGQIARIKVDVYGESAAEVASTLQEYAQRADAATQANDCSYGQQVIERNLEVEDGQLYSWKGRITLHPGLGREPFVPVGRLVDQLSD